MVVLKILDQEYGFSKHERLIFHQVIRTQYLVANGFQMLADDALTTAECKKFRDYAKEKVEYSADGARKEFRPRREITGKN
jgi:hypothetical protein